MMRLPLALVLLAFSIACHGHGLGDIGTVTVIDRDTGRALETHRYRGEYWVAGVPGARYAIEVRNRLGERLLAVASVDGVNVVSGETAAWDQTGYVLDAGDDYRIDGWRKSDTDVADFTFTALPNSYAARTGRAANIGVIGVALFREQPPPSSILLGESHSPPQAPAPANAPPPITAQAARAAAAAAARDEAAVTQLAEQTQVAKASRDEKLGTGHGEREYSYVERTEFVRLQPQPNELIRIHYDSMDNLVAMGIIRRPVPVPPDSPSANPFPGSPNEQYVPDPPG